MDYALESLADGRRVRLEVDKPLQLKVRRGDQANGEIVVGLRDGHPYLDNHSSALCSVNGIERTAALLAPGDKLQLATQRFRLIGFEGEVEVVEPPPRPVAPASESDRQHQQRRISASRMASVDAPPTGTSGLLKRVSAAFSGRAEKTRLDQLEEERRTALLEAGRRSLADGTALGIPSAAMAKLQHGQPVTIDPAQLDGLARWRESRQRLVRLDAEIAALRQTLGLGPDSEAVVLTTPTLRSDEQAKVERAFETMDAVGTQCLDDGSVQLPQPPAQIVKPRRSGHQRRR